MYICIYQNGKKNTNPLNPKPMLTNTLPQNVREFHLDLCEVASTADAWKYVLKMAHSRRRKYISREEYKSLAESLQLHCIAENISTKDEIAGYFLIAGCF